MGCCGFRARRRVEIGLELLGAILAVWHDRQTKLGCRMAIFPTLSVVMVREVELYYWEELSLLFASRRLLSSRRSAEKSILLTDSYFLRSIHARIHTSAFLCMYLYANVGNQSIILSAPDYKINQFGSYCSSHESLLCSAPYLLPLRISSPTTFCKRSARSNPMTVGLVFVSMNLNNSTGEVSTRVSSSLLLP